MGTLVSVDDHVVEHPKVWVDRLSRSKWGNRIPHIERDSDGSDYWLIDERRFRLSEIVRLGALMPDHSGVVQRWDDIPAAAYLPQERLKAMDRDGVDYSVLFPMVAGLAGQTFGSIKDADFELACVSAYNDWLIEDWAKVSPRFIPQCIVPIYPVEDVVNEIIRTAALGHKGVIFPGVPMHLRDIPHINEPEFDAVWSVCEELGLPLCLHAGSSLNVQLPPAKTMTFECARALTSVTRSASGVFDVANMLFSRILLRHPKLKVIFSESTLGWASFALEYADYQFEKDQCAGYELKPSEMFRRQCFFTTWYDSVRTHTHNLKAENIMWETNFPLENSSWPNTEKFIGQCLEGLTDEERLNITCKNAARLYRISIA